MGLLPWVEVKVESRRRGWVMFGLDDVWACGFVLVASPSPFVYSFIRTLGHSILQEAWIVLGLAFFGGWMCWLFGPVLMLGHSFIRSSIQIR